jgi:hypothetical protein
MTLEGQYGLVKLEFKLLTILIGIGYHSIASLEAVNFTKAC